MVLFSFLMMLFSVALEGVFFWWRDSVTRNLLLSDQISDFVWLGSLVLLFFYWWYPRVTVVSAWTLFLTSTIILERHQFVYSLGWIALRNSLVVTNVVFAHVGLHYQTRRNGAGRSR